MDDREVQIENYRLEHESDEEWEFRREFLDAHLEKFSDSKLKCLSHTYTNIEILGCRYPGETMKIIAELAAGLGDEHRKRKERTAQRFTMDASKSAEQRMKHRVAGFQPRGGGGGDYQSRGNYRGRGRGGGGGYRGYN